mgnify:CR=1 FL=1
MTRPQTPAERAREQAQRNAQQPDAERLAALAAEYERLAANAERMKQALDDHKPLKKGRRP